MITTFLKLTKLFRYWQYIQYNLIKTETLKADLGCLSRVPEKYLELLNHIIQFLNVKNITII